MYIEFELPEIHEYPSGFPQYWVKTLFIHSPSNRYQINALTSTYVRLVEAALFEYQAGSVKLKEYWATHSSLNLGAMHRSMSHFESCISNMYRAINCFLKLRRDRKQDPLSLLLNAEKAGFAADSVANRIRTIRNEIHHLEEMVVKERIADGQPFALKPDGAERPHFTEPNQTIKTIDKLVIGSREVRFNELAIWLTEMSHFAAKIADFSPSSLSNGLDQQPA